MHPRPLLWLDSASRVAQPPVQRPQLQPRGRLRHRCSRLPDGEVGVELQPQRPHQLRYVLGEGRRLLLLETTVRAGPAAHDASGRYEVTLPGANTES